MSFPDVVAFALLAYYEVVLRSVGVFFVRIPCVALWWREKTADFFVHYVYLWCDEVLKVGVKVIILVRFHTGY